MGRNGAGQLGRAVLNKAARNVAGANLTIRIETLMILADMRNAANTYDFGGLQTSWIGFCGQGAPRPEDQC